jgi:hypothetical protein
MSTGRRTVRIVASALLLAIGSVALAVAVLTVSTFTKVQYSQTSAPPTRR